METSDPLGVELVVGTQTETVQWLTGLPFTTAVVIDALGRVTLVALERDLEEPVVTDCLVSYEANWHSTMRNDRREACSAALVGAVSGRPVRLACQFSTFDHHLGVGWNAELVNIEPLILYLRCQKGSR